MSNVYQEYAVKLAEATPRLEDYTGEDGLLYCGKCRAPKQRYFPEGLKTLGIDRHRIDCECEKAQRLEREAAEQRRKGAIPTAEKAILPPALPTGYRERNLRPYDKLYYNTQRSRRKL